MASSITKRQYLLPGERTSFSSIVHHHGISKEISPILLRQVPEDNYTVISRTYQPKENDYVMGIIVLRASDSCLVDINSTELAILPITSFDRGKLPSRHAMNRFSVIYARVVRSDPWSQTELSCETEDRFKKKSNFGLIEYGYILRCSIELCQKLQQSQLIGQFNRLVNTFHIQLSPNGFVWYSTETMNSMIAVKNVIYKHELENDTNHLIDLYKTLINELEQEDERQIKLNQPQQPVIKAEKQTGIEK